MQLVNKQNQKKLQISFFCYIILTESGDVMPNFNKYGLKQEVLESIKNIGFTKPTKIQDIVIPVALKKINLIGKGKTGSGKTHSFLIPIANRIEVDNPNLQCIVLLPTRELSLQIYQTFKEFFKDNFSNLKITCLTGGKDSKRDLTKLNVTPQILIGTPEKIKKMTVDTGAVNLSTVNTFVIDEADMTLEMGFLNEVDMIANLVDKKAHIMVFSATIPVGIKPFLKKYLRNPVLLEDQTAVDNQDIEHILFPCRGKSTNETLKLVLENINPYVCLIFANTKKEVEETYKYLTSLNYDVAMIHGSLQSRERKRSIKKSLNGEFKYIVASDIASRGIDIPGVSHVISLGFPKNNLEFYLHRAGRCGRNNVTGKCISLYHNQDKQTIQKLMSMGIQFSHQEIKNDKWVVLKDFDARTRRVNKKVSEVDLEIKKVVIQNKNKKVKPNYKKKVKQQIDKIKRKHRREVIQKDIKKRQIKRAIENSKNKGSDLS